MADAELKVILKLLDEASADMKKVMSSLSNDMEKFKISSQKTTLTLQDQFKKVNSQIKQFRQTLLPLSLILATMMGSVKEAAKYNKEAESSFNTFSGSVRNFSTVLGSSLAPGLKIVSSMISNLSYIVELAVAGFIRLSSFAAEFTANLKSGPIEAFNKAMLVSNLAAEEYLKQIELSRDNADDENVKKESNAVESNKIDIEAIMLEQKKQLVIEYYSTINQLRNEDFQRELSTLQSSIELMQTFAETKKSLWARTFDFINTSYTTFKTGFGSAIASIATGAQTASEAFKQLGTTMVSTIVDFMAQALISMTLGRALAAATTAATTATAGAIAAAWAPAAYGASVATLGGAVGAGVTALAAGAGSTVGIFGGLTAAMKSVSVINQPGVVDKFHSGGFIRAHNGLAVDEVPIIAQTGEGILSRRGMSALGGINTLNALNSGKGNSGMITNNVYIDKASFTSQDGIDEVFMSLSRMIEDRRRAKI